MATEMQHAGVPLVVVSRRLDHWRSRRHSTSTPTPCPAATPRRPHPPADPPVVRVTCDQNARRTFNTASWAAGEASGGPGSRITTPGQKGPQLRELSDAPALGGAGQHRCAEFQDALVGFNGGDRAGTA
jgi:hypothetical protein